MRILVDAVPTEPEECLFMQFVEHVSEEVLEEAEICDDCGGVILGEDDVDIIPFCILTETPCELKDGECDCLANGYVTKF